MCSWINPKLHKQETKQQQWELISTATDFHHLGVTYFEFYEWNEAVDLWKTKCTQQRFNLQSFDRWIEGPKDW